LKRQAKRPELLGDAITKGETSSHVKEKKREKRCPPGKPRIRKLSGCPRLKEGKGGGEKVCWPKVGWKKKKAHRTSGENTSSTTSRKKRRKKDPSKKKKRGEVIRAARNACLGRTPRRPRKEKNYMPSRGKDPMATSSTIKNLSP